MDEINEEGKNRDEVQTILPLIENDVVSSTTRTQGKKELSVTKSQEIKELSDLKPLIDAQISEQSVLLGKKVQEELLDNLKSYIDERVKEVTENTKKMKLDLAQENTDMDLKFVKLGEDIEKFENKIENSKLSIIETLGMFVALFTFISVDFQIFKSYTEPVLIGALSSILIGSIFLFMIVFDYFIIQARKVRKTEECKDSKIYAEDVRASRARKILILLSAFFIFGGLASFFIIDNQEVNDNKVHFKEEILNSVQTNLDNQKKELEKITAGNSDTIKEINKRNTELKKCIKNFGFTYKCFEDN